MHIGRCFIGRRGGYVRNGTVTKGLGAEGDSFTNLRMYTPDAREGVVDALFVLRGALAGRGNAERHTLGLSVYHENHGTN